MKPDVEAHARNPRLRQEDSKFGAILGCSDFFSVYGIVFGNLLFAGQNFEDLLHSTVAATINELASLRSSQRDQDPTDI